MKTYNLKVKETNETIRLLNKLHELCNSLHAIMKVELLDHVFLIDVSTRMFDMNIDNIMTKLKEVNINAQ